MADTRRQTQYTSRLPLRGSQIRLLPGNQIRERESWEDEGILYTGGNPKKKVPLSGARISGTEHFFFGGGGQTGME